MPRRKEDLNMVCVNETGLYAINEMLNRADKINVEIPWKPT
jgi:hypothetical protein